MREDAPVPPRVPRKRRQLEDALDRWIAVWLSRADLTPSERRRLGEEKQRRKDLVPRCAWAFYGDEAGMTPPQKRTVRRLLEEMAPAAVFYNASLGASNALARVVKYGKLEEPPELHPRAGQEPVKEATVLIAAPKETVAIEGGSVWPAVRYARHRKIPVRIIKPDGTVAL